MQRHIKENGRRADCIEARCQISLIGNSNHNSFIAGMTIMRNNLGKTRVILIASCLGVFSAMPSMAAVISSFEDDFESESLSINYNLFAKWDVVDGSIKTVDTIGEADSFNLNCSGGSQVCVDLDGSTRSPGTLKTKDSFEVGSYNLSFDLSGSQRGDTNTVTVTLGDFSEDFTLVGSAPWATFNRAVTVSSESMLTFLNSGGDNVGIILDNVSVSSVPLPAAAWLFGSALLGLAGIKRRKASV